MLANIHDGDLQRIVIITRAGKHVFTDSIEKFLFLVFFIIILVVLLTNIALFNVHEWLWVKDFIKRPV